MSSTTTPGARTLSPERRALLERRLRGATVRPAGPVPRPGGGPAPLSPVQHSMWVMDQFLADNSVYSVYRAVWLRGPIDVKALRHATDELIRRHEILRSVYPDPADPVQVPLPPGDADLEVVDLAAAPDGRTAALALATYEVAQPFDLRHGPLFRVRVYQTTLTEALLLLAMHHIVSDEWSCDVLAREFSALYAGADLPEPELQYADFAAWQAHRVEGALAEQQTEYWRAKLGPVDHILRLPTTRQRPAQPTFRGGSVSVPLSAETTAALRAFVAARGTTVFAALFTAFAAVLGRAAGQERFAIGTLTLGRAWRQTEPLLGMFANTVAVPVDLTGDPGFAGALARTAEEVAGALDHQDISFEQVVAAVRPARDSSRNTLFQVLFQSVQADAGRWSVPGLDVEPVQLHNGSQKFDLTMIAVNRPEVVELQLEYASDLFDHADAERLAERVVGVLEQAIADPTIRLSAVNHVPDRERELVLHTWNQTRREIPTVPLHTLVERQADRVPDAAAVIDADGTVATYRELDERANQLAHRLRVEGVDRETPVAVCLDHGIGLFVALLGVLKAGGSYVPLDPGHPAERLSFVIGDTRARIVVTREGLLGLLPPLLRRSALCLDRDAAALDAEPRCRRPAANTNPDDLCYIMHTSGSTGRPKGVMISHRGLVNYLTWAIDAYGMDGASGAPMLGSPAFDLSVPNFWLPLITGNDVTVLSPDRSLAGLAAVLAEPRDFSLLKATPGHLGVLRGHLGEREGLDSVRTFVLGGDELRPENVAAWRRIFPRGRIINEYGPTETVVGCSIHEVGPDIQATVPIGRPIANTFMYVLDDTLNPVPVGVPGELCIGGDGVARGYFARPGLTAEKFVPDPYCGVPGARMYRTGDAARFASNGELEFLGRRDRQVKIRGYRVELGEIEAVLARHPEVGEAVVAVHDDGPGRRRIVAYIVAALGAPQDPAPLAAFAAAELPEHMVPALWVFLPELPLTAGAKIDRDRLPAPDATAHRLDEGGQKSEPVGERERELARIWSEVLGAESVGRHDDFFALGGDSILAIQVATRARQAGIDVTPRRLFELRTVAALVEAVSGMPEGCSVDVVERREAGSRTGPLPPTPIQHLMADTGIELDRYVMPVFVQWRGGVRPEVLEAALVALVRQHDALRIRVLRGVDGQLEASIVDSVADSAADSLLDVVEEAHGDGDLAAVAASAAERLSLSEGPVLRGVLLRTAAEDRVALIANHYAVDSVSWAILLEDLETAYCQLELGESVELPTSTTPFKEFAERLAEYANSDAFAAEADRWFQAGDEVAGLPVDGDGAGPSAEQVIRCGLAEEETRTLISVVPSAYGTRIDDVLLTAVAGVVGRWTGRNVVDLEQERHGRHPLFDDVDLTRTVGWFSAFTPVRLHVTAGDWGARLRSVSAQLAALPPDGLGAGLARYSRRDGRGWPARRPGIAVNYLGRLDDQHGGLSLMRRLAAPQGWSVQAGGTLPHAIEVNAAVVDGRLQTAWSFAESVFRRETVAALAEDFIAELKELITHCAAVGTAVRGGLSHGALFPGAPLILESMAENGIPGAALAVIGDDGEVTAVWGEGVLRAGAAGVAGAAGPAGVAEPVTGEPVTGETVFPVGSISKHVTALAVMRLVDRGVVALDEDVNRYLRSWRVPAFGQGAQAGPVTVRHLLGHTSGFREMKQLYLPPDGPVPTLVEVLEGGTDFTDGPVRPHFAPGTAFEYSNANSAVLEQLLVDVTGESFPAAVAALVLDPLGLTATRFSAPDAAPGAASPTATPLTGHQPDGTQTDPTAHLSIPAAAGGIWSTASDLALLGRDLQRAATGRPAVLLSHEAAVQMLRRPAFSNYGLGVTIHGTGADQWFSHGGEVPGFRSVLIAYAGRPGGFALLTNSARGAGLMYDILLAAEDSR
ncbi:amino acid adenylation domain-containing protein/non-ribosomal peptide synthase protein (TIGR01720 family) [Catenulispora sp. GP43]|uniref:amino acid adenylation domain-containing protein n=1 Tax=Catenulispora sp. GP43 TaxID=3156263 RepID=UPI003512062D